MYIFNSSLHWVINVHYWHRLSPMEKTQFLPYYILKFRSKPCLLNKTIHCIWGVFADFESFPSNPFCHLSFFQFYIICQLPSELEHGGSDSRGVTADPKMCNSKPASFPFFLCFKMFVDICAQWLRLEFVPVKNAKQTSRVSCRVQVVFKPGPPIDSSWVISIFVPNGSIS